MERGRGIRHGFLRKACQDGQEITRNGERRQTTRRRRLEHASEGRGGRRGAKLRIELGCDASIGEAGDLGRLRAPHDVVGEVVTARDRHSIGELLLTDLRFAIDRHT